MIKLFLLEIIALKIVISALGCNSSISTSDYNKITTFSENKPIKFHDFELNFTGERKDTSIFPNGNKFTFTYYVFKLKKDSKVDSVAWTGGNGVIGPIYFEFGGSKYSIELKYWEKEKKKLDEDELVVTKM